MHALADYWIFCDGRKFLFSADNHYCSSSSSSTPPIVTDQNDDCFCFHAHPPHATTATITLLLRLLGLLRLLLFAATAASATAAVAAAASCWYSTSAGPPPRLLRLLMMAAHSFMLSMPALIPEVLFYWNVAGASLRMFEVTVAILAVQSARTSADEVGWSGDQTCQSLLSLKMDMGGCQNYGPSLDPYYNTAPNI